MKTTDLFTSTALKPQGSGTEYCLAIGTRLSDFEITGVLGEGGFGIVYVAFDHSLQRTVAIKEYMPGALAGRGPDQRVVVRAERNLETFTIGMNSFINEARFLAQFDHPSLVKVYRYWEQNDTAYMAMRYYDGRTVKDIVSNSPELVTPAWCMGIVRQILDALDTLYTMKILHRDVSPDNIIVQANGDAVLLDFGSARQIIGDRIKGMTVILKPGYAPIEQYENDGATQQGAWTDIYALSAVMYFAMLKQAPLTSIGRMVKDPLLLLQRNRLLYSYGKPFLVAIDKGLAVHAGDRPQSIYEFRKMLGLDTAPTPQSRSDERARRSGSGSGKSGRGAGSSSRSEGSSKSAAKAGAAATAAPSASAAAAPAAATAKAAPAPGADQPKLKGHAAAAALAAGKWRQSAAYIAAGVLVVAVAGAYFAFSASDNPVVAAAAPAAPRPAAVTVAPALAAAAASADQPAAAPADADSEPGSANAANTAEAADTPATAAAATPEINGAVAGSTYKLTIQPWGTVYVDGAEQGVSPPLKKISIAAGKHTIRVVNPSFPEYVTVINVTNKQYGTIQHDFSQK